VVRRAEISRLRRIHGRRRHVLWDSIDIDGSVCAVRERGKAAELDRGSRLALVDARGAWHAAEQCADILRDVGPRLLLNADAYCMSGILSFTGSPLNQSGLSGAPMRATT
jgi:hypothetical protein